MDILASTPCKIIEGVIVNRGRFIKLELQVNEESHPVYLLTDPEPKFIKDLSTQQFMFAYSVFTSNEEDIDEYYTTPEGFLVPAHYPKKTKEKYVIATDKTYFWGDPHQIPHRACIVYSFELIDIDDVVKK